ncbi:MAG TPA: alpha-ketoacid dehydrogenase subunit beta [Candidatus Angelobacter sp.]|nr:alpha-ketoacid dehydrogenase subunit beta [Candidatus Angelobacter sp.]
MAVAAQTKRLLTTSKAIAEAIRQEMERDPSVFVMGEDIGTYGGIFGSTEGLLKKFGPDRVMDTPISETAFIGAALGAAVAGMRPIVELMFVDFFGVCMDQIYNQMGKFHYKTGGEAKVPVVVMTSIGGGYGDSVAHSQVLYATFAHLPGLKVVVPSSPRDAKGLMISAIRDDNPVVFFFHKGIMGLGWMQYNPRATGEVPEEAFTVPIGKAEVKREGRDLTIVTASLMVHRALDAAEILAGEGIDAEVLDLRSLVPLDREAICNSVRKTRRLLVVDEDYLSYGMTGEVVATVAEHALEFLDSPPARLAVPDVSIPYSRPLEEYVLPGVEKIIGACRTLAKQS